jgi:hypothetical protein
MEESAETTEPEEERSPLQLNSGAFAHETAIPVKYTCDGENISPPLTWSDPPEGTVGFALINDDPDAPAGTWVHWLLFNIPAGSRGLEEAVPDAPELPDGSRHGENSWGRLNYGGPCPPSGTHRYFFKLYALDKQELLDAMEGHVLEQAELMGTYTR